jgi:hypothetical protein
MAIRDQRAALAARRRLLDDILPLVGSPDFSVAPDGFPRIEGSLPGQRAVRVSLVPDTLVVRRLPQLWLIVTVRERAAPSHATVGAMARPNGAEFYSQVHDLPERIEPPPGLDPSILLRGDRTLDPDEAKSFGRALQDIFSDPRVKEVVATPESVRVVRQASEGERGAHLLLRQARFSETPLPRALFEAALADAGRLREALDRCGRRKERLFA